jgi:hypothetical protein
MPRYRPVGTHLVSTDELSELEVNAPDRIIEMQASEDTLEGIRGEAAHFEPIGLNKPLSVEIRHVYTGEHPKGAFPKNDLLVTSAMRSIATFNAQPRAVNFLMSNVKKNSNLRNPAATDAGTPLVFYAHALVEENSLMDIEVIFQRFPQELFEAAGAAFKAAAGIPIFVAQGAGTALMAAGAITKLAGGIGEKLFDGRPIFKQTIELSFTRGGSLVPTEGFHVITGPEFDIIREGLEFDAVNGRLLALGMEYDGPHPYVVISLDGRMHDDYADFVPTAASAALLESFFHAGDGQQQSMGILLDAVRLYNDYQFKSKANGVAAEMAALDVNSAEYQKLKERYDAYLANMLTDSFKLNTA